MLEWLHSSWEVLACGPPAPEDHLQALERHLGNAPSEYLQLVREATELELQHQAGQYVRIWGPMGCVEMDEGYGIRRRIPGAIPTGDDGGGRVVFYQSGKRGFGLYHVGFGNLDAEDAQWIAPSLVDCLRRRLGSNRFDALPSARRSSRTSSKSGTEASNRSRNPFPDSTPVPFSSSQIDCRVRSR